MLKNRLMVHGAWAATVLAAFVAGSSRHDTATTAGAGAGDGPAAPGRPATGRLDGSRGSDADRRSTRNDTRTGGEREDGPIGKLFGSLSAAAGGLDALAAQAVRDPNPITRRLAFTRLLEALTPENALSIREQLVALGAGEDQWRDFHYSWGALAGEEAFLHAVSSEERDMEVTLTGWAAANPAEAMALLDNLPENLRDQRDRLAASVVAGVADHDRNLATDLALRLAGEDARKGQNLIGIVAGEELRAGGPHEASLWAEALPDGPLKGAAMSRIAGDYVRNDPEGAAQWAGRYAGEDFAARAVQEVGARWARSDPEAAVGWLRGLPAGSGQSAGLRSAFGDWEDRDPAAATDYLSSMARSPQRDAAISGFSSGYAWQDPRLAIDWAQEISDPNLRQQTLTQAGQAFFRRDPDSARAWLASSGLPADAQQAVLNPRR